jgi:hypothetical protein
MSKWIRYRFKTTSIDDSRPVEFPPPGPWWETGFSGDGVSYAICIAYLPAGKRLLKYWPEAFQIESDECDEITFTDRFPRPDWWKG